MPLDRFSLAANHEPEIEPLARSNLPAAAGSGRPLMAESNPIPKQTAEPFAALLVWVDPSPERFRCEPSHNLIQKRALA